MQATHPTVLTDCTEVVQTAPIDVKNLNVAYQTKRVLEDINLSIQPGKITGIIGPNGAGKSTLLKSLLGLIKTQSGEIEIAAKPIGQYRKNIAYVEQRSGVDLTFPIQVVDVVLLGTYPHIGLFKRPKKKDRDRAVSCLATVKMSEYGKRQIGSLSGGQLQRVFIARALAQNADIIFLDEPFVGIDMTSEKVIVDLLKELRDAGKTIVIVHHDLHKVAEYFDNVIILNRKLVTCGPVESSFTAQNIQQAYGDSMGNIQVKGVDGKC